MGWFSLIWSETWRRPGRTALTAASLASAFLLLGLLAPILTMFADRGDFTGVERLVVQPRYSITDFLPVSHAAVIASLPGVRATTHLTWFGGTFRDGVSSFPRWAVPPESYLDLRPEILLPAAQHKAFIGSRTGVIVGRATARRFSLSVGDRIALVPDIWPNKDGGAWEFQIVGIFDGADRTVDLTALYMNYAYFDEYRTWGHGLVGDILVGLEPTARAADVAAEIDTRFANSADETTTASERDYALEFADQLGDVGLMLGVIIGAVIFSIALVSANTVANGVRERIGELAVLNALGFDRGAIRRLVVGETVVLVALGAVPGLLSAAALIAVGRRAMPQLGGIAIGFDTIASAISVALALTVLAVSEPMWRIGRMRIVDALRALAH